eukprot:gene3278-5720_t
MIDLLQSAKHNNNFNQLDPSEEIQKLKSANVFCHPISQKTQTSEEKQKSFEKRNSNKEKRTKKNPRRTRKIKFEEDFECFEFPIKEASCLFFKFCFERKNAQKNDVARHLKELDEIKGKVSYRDAYLNFKYHTKINDPFFMIYSWEDN